MCVILHVRKCLPFSDSFPSRRQSENHGVCDSCSRTLFSVVLLCTWFTIQYDALHYIQYYTAHVFLCRKAKKNAKGKGTRVPLLSGWFDGCRAPRTSGFCCRFTALKVSSNVTQLSGFIARLFEVFCVGDVFYSSALTHLMYFS